ncbi:unnamed protein product [Malus baccata var. baccata]
MLLLRYYDWSIFGFTVDLHLISYLYVIVRVKLPNHGSKKTNEKGLKTLSFNDKDKIKGKVNSTRIDFLVEEQYLSGDVGRIFVEPRKFLGVFISCILFCSTVCDFGEVVI